MAVSLAMVASAPVAHSANAGSIEEIIVTARKREESSQSVPEAISAVSAQQIEQSFQTSGAGLEGMAPNLVFDRVIAGPGGAALSIRGLSFQDIEKSFDPSVGVALDGVFLGTNTGQVFQVFDVERIEVLRGPQGTLFGKNTIGGIINIERPEPTGVLDGKIRFDSGSRSKQNIEGILNLPTVANQLSSKIFFTSREQDGEDRNLYLGGKRVGGVDYQSYGASLKWTPSDSMKFVYTYQREEDDSPIAGLENYSLPTDLLCFAFLQCAQSADGVISQTGEEHLVNQNGSNEQFYNVNAHTLKGSWDLTEGYTLDYLYGYRGSDEGTEEDFDASPVPFYETLRAQDFSQQSHELRLTYDEGGRFNLVSGLYYWRAEYDLHQEVYHFFDILSSSLGIPGAALPIVFTQDTSHSTKSWAAFVQSDINLSNEWILTLGGRYTREEKNMTSRQDLQFTGFGPGIASNLFNTASLDPEESWSKFTPKVGLRWQITPDQMLYYSYSTGFRSGGYNGRAGSAVSASTPYDPEIVKSHEIGYKSQWLDDRLRFNINIFHSVYDDKQEEIVLPVNGFQETLVTNASKAKFDGMEVELVAIPTDGWTLRANAGYLDARYDSFCAYTGDVFDPAPACGPADSLGNVPGDYSGLELRRAPKFTASLDSTYVWALGPGEATINIAARYKDDYYSTFQNIPMGLTESATIYDASLSYDWGDWRLSVYGHNLTDKVVRNSALAVAGLFSFGSSSLGREYGAQLQYNFGQ